MEIEVTIVAKVFVVNSNGLILVLRRSASDTHRPLTWDLPGGGVERGENPNEAVIRETSEEAGLSIKSPTIFYVTSSNRSKYVIRLLYYTFSDDNKVVLSDEHDQISWVTREEFQKLDVPEYFLEAVKQLPG